MFTEKLENAVRGVEGGRAAILMGFDGIQVESFEADDDLDIETIGMEFSVVLKDVRKAAEMMESGDAEEITVRTDKVVTVLRIINDDYFLALTVSSDGNLGKARYVLRMLAPQLIGDLV